MVGKGVRLLRRALHDESEASESFALNLGVAEHALNQREVVLDVLLLRQFGAAHRKYNLVLRLLPILRLLDELDGLDHQRAN